MPTGDVITDDRNNCFPTASHMLSRKSTPFLCKLVSLTFCPHTGRSNAVFDLMSDCVEEWMACYRVLNELCIYIVLYYIMRCAQFIHKNMLQVYVSKNSLYYMIKCTCLNTTATATWRWDHMCTKRSILGRASRSLHTSATSYVMIGWYINTTNHSQHGYMRCDNSWW